MTQLRWVIVALLLSVFGFTALLARYVPAPTMLSRSMDTPVPVAAPARKRPVTQPRRERGFVLNDVYTSDAAAEKAYMEQIQAQAAVQGATDEAGMLVPETFIGLLDSLAGETEGAADESASNEPEWMPSAVTPLPVTPSALQTRRAVQSVVERFLRDAFNERDADAYVAALDEDFRYTYDAGTPDNPDDDRSYRGRGYETIGIHRVFERFTDIESELSPPRDFQLLRQDAAQITYDYDIALRNPRETRRVGGTATFLVMRGGTTGESDDWRIVEWYDIPPARSNTR
jgi:hypothetical protein